MKVREGYKMTEVGVIPNEWEVKPFGTLFLDMKSGLSRMLRSEDVGVPCIRSNNIVNGKINKDDLKYWFWADDKGANVKDYVLKDGDILVNFINSLAQIGKTCIYNDIGREAIYTTNIFRIKVNENIVLNTYFYYLTLSERYVSEVKLITKPAVNQASFTTGDFKNIKMPIATLPEQQRIAEILSSNDTIITKINELIEKAKEVKQGLMQELLTKGIGHTEFKDSELGRIPREWIVDELGKYVEIRSGYSPSQFQLEAVGTYPFFKVNDMNYASKYLCNAVLYFEDCTYSLMETGMVVFPKRGASIFTNKINILSATGFFDTNIMGLNVMDSLFNEFLYYYLQYLGLSQFADTTSVPQINNKHIIPLIVPIPSLNEQREIASILSSIDEKIDAFEKRKQQLEEIKQGLMQDLLTGRVRVNLN